MAEGRMRENWNHTSSILCLLSNIHRDPKKSKASKPGNFHPMGADPLAQQHRAAKAPITILKHFVPGMEAEW